MPLLLTFQIAHPCALCVSSHAPLRIPLRSGYPHTRNCAPSPALSASADLDFTLQVNPALTAYDGTVIDTSNGRTSQAYSTPTLSVQVAGVLSEKANQVSWRARAVFCTKWMLPDTEVFQSAGF